MTRIEWIALAIGLAIALGGYFAGCYPELPEPAERARPVKSHIV